MEPSISGKYVCEISADAPSFHTEIGKLLLLLIDSIQLTVTLPTVSSEMEVVDVPTNKPVITEIKTHYRMSEVIRGNCTSQYSRPASNLTWLVNDKPTAVSC